MALRSGFEFALPLAGFDSGEDRRGQQDAKYRAWAHQFSAMLGEGERRHGLRQGLTLVHFSAQRKRFLWVGGAYRGCLGDAQEVSGDIRGC